jgi:hypothetical protein
MQIKGGRCAAGCRGSCSRKQKPTPRPGALHKCQKRPKEVATIATEMRRFTIPEQLPELISEGRLIPFIGAGFSAAHGLPGWEEMLEKVTDELEDCPLSYGDIREACNDDPLQIAEYLFLVSGEQIGPLRHLMSGQLRPSEPVLQSSAHIELVNLGAPQVYTTNFDELIEQTYRALNEPVEVVALPRDVATSHGEGTQVVKYHGDLRHEKTLVLTESQYYKRLDFESPMDLKFRADLLGRAVLFMGYSFRDINIRVIWFKLLQMMQEVPKSDQLVSYIVRFEPNEVLERLYDAVGLSTLVIDPDGSAETPGDRRRLFADFMLTLAMSAPGGARPPRTGAGPYVSSNLLANIDDELQRVQASGREQQFYPVFLSPDITPLVTELARRKPHPDVRDRTEKTYGRIAGLPLSSPQAPNVPGALAKGYIDAFGPGRPATLAIVTGLLSQFSRQALLDPRLNLEWNKVWEGRITVSDAVRVVDRLQSEVMGHEQGGYDDDDLAYAVDLAYRIVNGSLVEAGADLDELKAQAQNLIDRAAEIYPAVEAYEAPLDRAPRPTKIIHEIDDAAAARAEQASEDGLAELTADDDMPF